MTRRFLMAGVLAVLLVVALVAAGCGGTTTTTAPSTVTTAATGATESTVPASTGTTAAPGTDTTTAVGPATGQPIKIGLSNSLTGNSAAPGASIDKGVRLEIENVNQNGGINGRPLELIEYDDKSEVTNAVANINKMIEDDQVFATIGPFNQWMQEPARQLAEQYKVPMVGHGPVTVAQLSGTQYQWGVVVSAGAPVQADAAKKIIKENGWKNILGIGDVIAIDQEVLDLLVKDASTSGYTMTKMPDSFGLDQQDFQPILNRMMEEINKTKPDAICLFVNMMAAPPLYKGLRNLGVTVPILGSPAAAHPATLGILGPPAVEGLMLLDCGGILNPASLPATWPLKQIQLDFVERYRAKYDKAPDYFSAAGADLVLVLVEAMKKAGAVDRDKVQQALINLKDVPTLEGLVSFSPDSTSMGVHGQMVEFVVKNGKFEMVETLN